MIANNDTINFCGIEYYSSNNTNYNRQSGYDLFQAVMCDGPCIELIDDIKMNIPMFMGTWGLKKRAIDEDITGEIYFFRSQPGYYEANEIARKYIDIPVLETGDNQMEWSFDVMTGDKSLNIYYNNGGFDSNIHLFGGCSYKYTGEQYRYANTYYFWRDPILDYDYLKNRITNCPFSAKRVIDNIFLHEAIEHYEKVNPKFTIVTANKQTCDCIYYMSLDVNMLIVFLRAFEYPSTIIDTINSMQKNLNHLMFEVSIDYDMDGITKTGFYVQL